MDINEIEITRDMMEAVALCSIYKEDVENALRKVCPQVKRPDEINALAKRILATPQFAKVKEDVIKLEKMTLIDDDVDTIELVYNDLIKEARFEKKYDVALRVLKELRTLKAITDDETKFEINITVEKPNGEVGDTV